MKLLGEILRNERLNKGLTQGELGKLLNTTNSCISNYEAGNSTPDVYTLIKLSQIFDVTLDYLTGNNNTEKSQKTIVIPLVKNLLEKDLLNTENINENIFVSKDLFKDNNLFAYRITNDSNHALSIFTGDIIIASPECNYKNGDLVIAGTKTEFIIKRIYVIKSEIVLTDNYYPPILLNFSPKTNLIGVVKYRIKKYI